MTSAQEPSVSSNPSDVTSATEPSSIESVSEEKAKDWYDLWRGRIQNWIQENTDHQLASVLLLLPDLLALLVRLAGDRRVPFLLKAQLLGAAAYVISPIDLMPEAVLGVLGLTDDLTVLALIMLWLKNIVKIDPVVLRDNWSREEDPVETIEMLRGKVVENADKLFNQEIWQKIQTRFGKPTPQEDANTLSEKPS
jgi:uncharacterized membrane protein YkvA (DUF1232 family)